ncbi:DUF4384 domain-containing protein [Aestuariispira insulae]|uniref:Uncharacterized protein DUF4384 n=1 Tax=Aestuariispira insulae TaxID=1461337 RepID=A0A3D9HVL2_9PROT|nr:DUF4384 domain-containing protein [Aestuariispira insulae]RED53554.1 uncharacterized protein DUF4384 [Aestuariispira insulae]
MIAFTPFARKLLTALVLPLILLSFKGAAMAADADRTLRKLAIEIIYDVPRGKKLAIRPFFDQETDLPRDIADSLYDSLFTAFFRVSAGDHVFVERQNLIKIMRSREEFYAEDLEQLLRSAKADVEIICTPTPHVDGVLLACNASDLLHATTLGRAQAVIPLDAKKSGAQPYELALSDIAFQVAPKLGDLKAIDRIAIRDQNKGSQTDLGAWLGKQLATQVESRVSQKQRQDQEQYERQRELDETAQETMQPTGHYSLTGTLYRLDETTLQLLVSFDHRGQTAAKGSAKLTLASLPESHQESQNIRERVFSAVGEAIVSAKLDQDAARRAAQNLARARVVAQALGIPGPAVKEIVSEADAAHALTKTLSAGIPIEERFIDINPTGPGERIAVEIRARVLPVGTVLVPDVKARLSKGTYRAMEPIYLDVSSTATAFIGVYSWGADNRVVRIFPNPRRPSLAVEPDSPLLLPGEKDGRFMSMPLPGYDNPEDHEALIVIASNKPTDFKSLAPEVGQTLSETMKRSTDGSQFFNALSKLDVSRISIHILPYQVRR